MRLARWLESPRPAVLAVLGVLLPLFGGAAFLHPLYLQVGSAFSEAPGHLWGLWTVADGLWETGPLLRSAPGLGWPDGFASHLIDPANLLLFLPGYWLAGGGMAGASLGWNLLHAGTLVVAALGCIALAREVARPPDGSGLPGPAAPARPAASLLAAIPILAATFAGGSWLFGHPHMGRTELLPACWLPLQVALLLAFVRGTGGWRAGVGAGGLLGLVALGGGYLPVFAALLEIPLALGLLLRPGPAAGGRLRVLGRLAAVAALGLATAAPGIWALVRWPPPSLSMGAPPPQMVSVDSAIRVLWDALGPAGLGMAVRWGPAPDLAPYLEQPPYLGVVALALALAGCVLRFRRTAPWLALALGLAILGLGSALPLQPAFLVLPAGWLERLVPPLHAIREWSRIGCLFPLPLGVAAFLGAEALLARIRGPRLQALGGLLLAFCVLADQLTWPRTDPLDRPSFDGRAPNGLVEALAPLPEGAMLALPLEVALGMGTKLEAARYQLWHLQHRRPVSATPDLVSDTALRTSALARVALNRQFGLSGRLTTREARVLSGATGDLPAGIQEVLRAELHALHTAGFAVILIARSRPAGPEIEALLGPVLGPPHHEAPAFALWDLARLDPGEAPVGASPAEDLPPVPPSARMMLEMDGIRRGERPPPPDEAPGSRRRRGRRGDGPTGPDGLNPGERRPPGRSPTPAGPGI